MLLTYCKSKILLFIVHENLLCGNLTVTGDNYADALGTYIISSEKAGQNPDKPVYKLDGRDRYIFYSPTFGAGWRIARKEHLAGEKEGLKYYESKNFIPF